MDQSDPYRRLYPTSEAIQLDHGLNNKYEKALIQPSESPDCLNVVFVNRSVTTRGGAVRVNTNAVAAFAFDGLYARRASDNSETMLAFVGGTMYALGSTTFVTVPSAQSVFTMGQRVGLELAENRAFMGNGGAGPYKWDGTNFTLHGVIPPPTTMSVASATTGSLTTNGVYKWWATYVNSALVESNLSPVSNFTVSNVGMGAVLTSIPVGSSPSQGIFARYIYRTIASGSSPLRVTKINDNTTTTFTDTVADAALGQAAPTDNGLPPQYNAIIYSNNILFMNDVNNPNFVWFSVPGQPYTVASTNFFKVGNNSSDLVKGFASFASYIVIFCQQSTWINYMPNSSDPTTWRQLKNNSPYGSSSPYCLLNVNDTILHPAIQNKKFVGFARVSGNTLDPSNTILTISGSGSLLTSDKIETDMFNVQEGFLSNISGVVYKNQAYITLTYGSAATTNNRMYFFDFSMENLTQDQMVSWSPWTGLNIQQMCVYGGKLYGASSTTNGFVYQLGDTGVFSDDGVAINSYIWTKELQGYDEDTNVYKDFRYVNVLYNMSGNYFMNMTYKTDSDLGSGQSTQISLNPGGNLWGSFLWGTGTWGAGIGEMESRIYLGPTRGKRLQIQFSNQNIVNQTFKVYRFQMAYNLRGYR